MRKRLSSVITRTTGSKLRVVVIAVVALTCGMYVTSSEAAGSLPEIRPVKTRKPPTIDGRLDDACWRSAAKANNFVARLENHVAEVQTEAYLVYDDERLYVGFRCHEPNIAGLRAVDDVNKYWQEGENDMVAVFVGPQEEEKPYYQFGVNLRGIAYERGHLKQRNIDIPGAIEARAEIGEACWTAEMAIPFKVLGVEEQMGKVWRLNLNRLRAQTGETSTWAPVNAQWHNPALFGYLRGLIIGGNPEKPEVYLKETALGTPLIGRNTASVKIRARKKGRYRITATLLSPAGKATETVREVSLESREVKEIAFPYDIQPMQGEHKLTLTFVDANTGKLCYESPDAAIDIPSLLDAYLVRNYYTTEDEAELGIELSLPAEKVAEVSLEVEVRDADSSSLTQKKVSDCKRENLVQLSIARLKCGTYDVSVTARDGSGRIISRATDILAKHPPNPGDEVKVDRSRRCFLLNGEPFFPVGVYWPSIDKLPMLKKMGLNFVQGPYLFHGYSAQRNADTLKLMGKARDLNMRVGIGLFHAGSGCRKFFEEYWPDEVDRLLRQVRKYPNVLYYDMIGEGGGYRDELNKLYGHIKEVDAYHPATLVFCRRINIFESYDVAAIDAYFSAGRKGRTPLSCSGVLAQAASQVAERQRMPLLIVSLIGRSSGSLRDATDREQKLTAYLALIYGAKGINWFALNDPPRIRDTWLAWCEVIKEANVLGPILMERAPEQLILKERGANSPIHMRAMKHGKRLYLIGANAFRADVEVEIGLGNLTSKGSVARVLFEDRKLRLHGTELTDKFEGYTTHVYELALSKEAEEPYEITVRSTDLGSRYNVDDYFLGKTAWHHPYSDAITITGQGHTLESLAARVANRKLFAYDKTARRARVAKPMFFMAKSTLTIGDEKDPDKGEALECGSIRFQGHLTIYNSKLDGGFTNGNANSSLHMGEIGTLYAKNTEFTNFRYLLAARRFVPEVQVTRLEDCDIYGNQWALHNSGRGTYVRCKIHDNTSIMRHAKPRYVRGQPSIFIDCRIYDNEDPCRFMGQDNYIYISTTDDHMHEYEYTTGSMTFGWHLTLSPEDASKARKGLTIWLDADGDRFDRRAGTDDQGVARLDAVQFYEDKDGRKNITYEVKLSEDGETWRTVKESLCVQTNMAALYATENGALQEKRR